ncbi:winged helix DNA-binding domain-containing protein [Lacisediminihabitans sp. FW035]
MSVASPVLTQKELLARRLAAQQLIPTASASVTVADTVRRMFATQSQGFGQSVWGVGLRTPGAGRSDVLRAMAEGSVVRSSSLRGTLMMVAAEDLRGILTLTAERTIASTRTRQRQLELDEATMSRAREVIEGAIAGRNALGRDAVMRTLEDAGIRTDSQRGYHILWLLAERGIVCWGPPNGTQQGLVLVEEWIAPAVELDRDELLTRFAIRYLTGHGPSTVADLAWWGRLSLTDVRRGIAAAGDALCDVTVDGVVHWMVADPDAPPTLRADALALPGFDEYLLGYSERSAPLPPQHFEKIVPGGNGIFLPTIVAAGRVIGTWRRTVTQGITVIVPEPFGALTPAQSRTFDAAAERYREFHAN